MVNSYQYNKPASGKTDGQLQHICCNNNHTTSKSIAETLFCFYSKPSACFSRPSSNVVWPNRWWTTAQRSKTGIKTCITVIVHVSVQEKIKKLQFPRPAVQVVSNRNDKMHVELHVWQPRICCYHPEFLIMRCRTSEQLTLSALQWTQAADAKKLLLRSWATGNSGSLDLHLPFYPDFLQFYSQKHELCLRQEKDWDPKRFFPDCSIRSRS